MQSREARYPQFVETEFGQKFLSRGFVVVPAIGPEELGESENLGIGGAVRECFGMRDNQLQNTLLARPESRELIEDDGIDGDGCLGQPICQRLLARGEMGETSRLKLNEAGGSHAIHTGLAYLSALRLRPSGNRANQCQNPCRRFHPVNLPLPIDERLFLTDQYHRLTTAGDSLSVGDYLFASV